MNDTFVDCIKNRYSLHLYPNLFNFVKHYKQYRMKINRIFAVAFWIITVVMLVQCTSDEERLHKELSKMADNLNKSTPVAFDLHTRFDSVAVTSENVFQYFYTVTDIDNPDALLREKKADIIDKMKKAFETDRSLQIFVQNNVTMEYIYRDTSQKVIDKIRIDASNPQK